MADGGRESGGRPRARMTISAASAASGVSAKMIRYYEQVGLLPPASRSASGYRTYGPADVHTLRFVRRARDLGFSVQQIAELLLLWQDQGRASADVKALAGEHIRTLQEKIDALQGMVNTLQHLVKHCHGDARPDCPILEELASHQRNP